MAKGANAFCLPPDHCSPTPTRLCSWTLAWMHGLWFLVCRGQRESQAGQGGSTAGDGCCVGFLCEPLHLSRPSVKGTASVSIPLHAATLPGSCGPLSPLVLRDPGTTGVPHGRKPQGPPVPSVPQTLPASSLNSSFATFSSIPRVERAVCFLPGPGQGVSLLSIFMSFV